MWIWVLATASSASPAEVTCLWDNERLVTGVHCADLLLAADFDDDGFSLRFAPRQWALQALDVGVDGRFGAARVLVHTSEGTLVVRWTGLAGGSYDGSEQPAELKSYEYDLINRLGSGWVSIDPDPPPFVVAPPELHVEVDVDRISDVRLVFPK